MEGYEGMGCVRQSILKQHPGCNGHMVGVTVIG